MSDNIKFGISLPTWIAEELEILAKINGTARATLAASIVTSYVNYSLRPEMRDVRDKALEAIASRKNITIDQLIQEWLNEEN